MDISYSKKYNMNDYILSIIPFFYRPKTKIKPKNRFKVFYYQYNSNHRIKNIKQDAKTLPEYLKKIYAPNLINEGTQILTRFPELKKRITSLGKDYKYKSNEFLNKIIDKIISIKYREDPIDNKKIGILFTNDLIDNIYEAFASTYFLIYIYEYNLNDIKISSSANDAFILAFIHLSNIIKDVLLVKNDQNNQNVLLPYIINLSYIIQKFLESFIYNSNRLEITSLIEELFNKENNQLIVELKKDKYTDMFLKGTNHTTTIADSSFNINYNPHVFNNNFSKEVSDKAGLAIREFFELVSQEYYISIVTYSRFLLEQLRCGLEFKTYTSKQKNFRTREHSLYYNIDNDQTPKPIQNDKIDNFYDFFDDFTSTLQKFRYPIKSINELELILTEYHEKPYFSDQHTTAIFNIFLNSFFDIDYKPDDTANVPSNFDPLLKPKYNKNFSFHLEYFIVNNLFNILVFHLVCFLYHLKIGVSFKISDADFYFLYPETNFYYFLKLIKNKQVFKTLLKTIYMFFLLGMFLVGLRLILFINLTFKFIIFIFDIKSHIYFSKINSKYQYLPKYLPPSSDEFTILVELIKNFYIKSLTNVWNNLYCIEFIMFIEYNLLIRRNYLAAVEFKWSPIKEFKINQTPGKVICFNIGN